MSRFHSLRSFIDFDPMLLFMYSNGHGVTVLVSQSHAYLFIALDPLLFFIYSVMVTVSWSWCHGQSVTVTCISFIALDPLLFFLYSIMVTVSWSWCYTVHKERQLQLIKSNETYAFDHGTVTVTLWLWYLDCYTVYKEQQGIWKNATMTPWMWHSDRYNIHKWQQNQWNI